MSNTIKIILMICVMCMTGLCARVYKQEQRIQSLEYAVKHLYNKEFERSIKK